MLLLLLLFSTLSQVMPKNKTEAVLRCSNRDDEDVRFTGAQRGGRLAGLGWGVDTLQICLLRVRFVIFNLSAFSPLPVSLCRFVCELVLCFFPSFGSTF